MITEKIKSIRLYWSAILWNEGKTFLQRFIEVTLLLIIIINVGVSIYGTANPSLYSYKIFFQYFDGISITIFTVEYILRLWVAPIHKKYAEKSFPRLRFALSPLMIADFLAIVPFYFIFIPFGDPRWLRIFRITRIFRVLRISKYSTAFHRILEVIKREKEELIAIFWLMLITLCFVSTLLYLSEQSNPKTQFTSIPSSFWWGITTLTTVGYGDMVPITDLGKLFGAIASVLGVGIFALPTGLLGASFYHDVAKRRERQITKMGQKIGEIFASTEESSEKLDEFTKSQERKIKKLQKELEETKKELNHKNNLLKKEKSRLKKQ